MILDPLLLFWGIGFGVIIIMLALTNMLFSIGLMIVILSYFLIGFEVALSFFIILALISLIFYRSSPHQIPSIFLYSPYLNKSDIISNRGINKQTIIRNSIQMVKVLSFHFLSLISFLSKPGSREHRQGVHNIFFFFFFFSLSISKKFNIY